MLSRWGKSSCITRLLEDYVGCHPACLLMLHCTLSTPGMCLSQKGGGGDRDFGKPRDPELSHPRGEGGGAAGQPPSHQSNTPALAEFSEGFAAYEQSIHYCHCCHHLSHMMKGKSLTNLKNQRPDLKIL